MELFYCRVVVKNGCEATKACAFKSNEYCFEIYLLKKHDKSNTWFVPRWRKCIRFGTKAVQNGLARGSSISAF